MSTPHRQEYVNRSLEIAAYLHARNANEREVLQKHILTENSKFVRRLETVQPTYRFRATSPRRDTSPAYAASKEQTVKRIYSSVPSPKVGYGTTPDGQSFPYLYPSGGPPPPGSAQYPPSQSRARGPEADEFSTPVNGHASTMPPSHHAQHTDGRLVGSARGGHSSVGSMGPHPTQQGDGQDWRAEAFRLQDELQRMAQQMLDYRHATEHEKKAMSHKALEDELTILERERQLERMKMALEASEARAADAERKHRLAESSEKESRKAVSEALQAIEVERSKNASLAQSLSEKERSERDLMAASQSLKPEAEERLRAELQEAREQAQRLDLQLQEAVKKIVDTEKERDAALAGGASSEEVEGLKKEVAKHEQAVKYLRDEVSEARSRLLQEEAKARGKTLEVEALQSEMARLREAQANGEALPPPSEPSPELLAKLTEAQEKIGALEAEVAALKEQAASAPAPAPAPLLDQASAERERMQSNNAELRQQIHDTLDQVRASYAGGPEGQTAEEGLARLKASLEQAEERIAALLGEASFLENEVYSKEMLLKKANTQQAELNKVNNDLKVELERLLEASKLMSSEGGFDPAVIAKLQGELEETNSTVSTLLGRASFLENEIALKEREVEHIRRDHEAVRQERDTLKAALTRKLQQSSIERSESTALFNEEGAEAADPLDTSMASNATSGGDPVQSLRRKVFDLEQKNSAMKGEASLMENDLHGKERLIEKLKAEIEELKAGAGAGATTAAASAPRFARSGRVGETQEAIEGESGEEAAADAPASSSAPAAAAGPSEDLSALQSALDEKQSTIVELEDKVKSAEEDTARLEDLLIKQQLAYKDAQVRAAQLEEELATARATLAAYGGPAYVPAAPAPAPEPEPEAEAAPSWAEAAQAAEPSLSPAPSSSLPAPMSVPSMADNGLVTYSISLETHSPNVPLSSSPDITLQIFGVEGGMEPEIESSVVRLGETFVFDCSTEPLGTLAACRIWHNVPDNSLTFFVERVVVFNRNSGEATVFEVQQDVRQGEEAAVMVTLGGEAVAE